MPNTAKIVIIVPLPVIPEVYIRFFILNTMLHSYIFDVYTTYEHFFLAKNDFLTVTYS